MMTQAHQHNTHKGETAMDKQLREAFADVDSANPARSSSSTRSGSTAMKEQQPEASWLPSLGFMYDTVTAIVVRICPDAEIKYLGDGIMISLDSDRATDAVNIAIEIQEAINDANQGRTGAKGAVDFNRSAGISTGAVVAFPTPTGNRDYVGTVVDKARRLCDAASPKAVFVDRATVAHSEHHADRQPRRYRAGTDARAVPGRLAARAAQGLRPASGVLRGLLGPATARPEVRRGDHERGPRGSYWN